MHNDPFVSTYLKEDTSESPILETSDSPNTENKRNTLKSFPTEQRVHEVPANKGSCTSKLHIGQLNKDFSIYLGTDVLSDAPRSIKK